MKLRKITGTGMYSLLGSIATSYSVPRFYMVAGRQCMQAGTLGGGGVIKIYDYG